MPSFQCGWAIKVKEVQEVSELDLVEGIAMHSQASDSIAVRLLSINKPGLN